MTKQWYGHILLQKQERSFWIMNTIHELHIPIVAEGVETKEQMERLKRLKVEYIQGYYYAKPMPQKEFLAFVREKNQLHERNEETE